MGIDTKIEWTDHTFNPWWGCQRVSPACEHCYAETFSHRIGGSPWAKGEHWGPRGLRTLASEKQWAQPLAWNAAAEKAGVRRRVFCASMADVGEDRRDLDAPRARLRALIEATPHLDWLLLTKRPDSIVRLMGWPGAWPRNVWAGTTVESQKYADERIPHLLSVPAAVHFLSIEPLLEAVDLRALGSGEDCRVCNVEITYDAFDRTATCGCCIEGAEPVAWGKLDWVICGGESGPGARPFDLAWARSLVGQCLSAGVPVFVKQLGARPVGTCGRCRGDGIDPVRVGHDPEWCGECGGGAQNVEPALIRLESKKGGEMNEWPEDLRVREFPR